jgi:hypothetical protein
VIDCLLLLELSAIYIHFGYSAMYSIDYLCVMNYFFLNPK